ncbi:MAG: hypothetical protein WCI47_00690 [bacterium]
MPPVGIMVPGECVSVPGMYPGVVGTGAGGWYAGVPGAPPPPQIRPASTAAWHFQVVVGAGGFVVGGTVTLGGDVTGGFGFGFGCGRGFAGGGGPCGYPIGFPQCDKATGRPGVFLSFPGNVNATRT